MLNQLSLAHRSPPAEASHSWFFRQDSLVKNGCADTPAPRAVCRDAAPGAVIQDGGQGPEGRDNTPGTAIWQHSYIAEPSLKKALPLSTHRNHKQQPHRGLLGESMCSRWRKKAMAPPLQYSCLENPMDRGAWWATVHGVAQSRT